MPLASSDTQVIEIPLLPKQPAVAMPRSGQFEERAKSGHVIEGVFGTPAKRPCVTAAVFEAHDTMLDWVGFAKKLESFRALKKGWDGYRAAPPETKPLEFAVLFLDLLRQNRSAPSRLAPSVVGGVGMTFRNDGRKVYVEFSNKGTVHALFSDGVTDPVIQKVTPDLPGYRALFAKTRAYLYE